MAPLPAGYRPWYRAPAAWVICAGIIVRLTVAARFAQTPWFLQQMGDMRFYHLWAQRILAGKPTDGHAFYGLPGYAFWLAGVYRLAGSAAWARSAAVCLLQIIPEVTTALIIFKLANKFCESERIEGAKSRLPIPAMIAALVWIVFLPAQAFSAILMPTSWLVCAYWLGVWRASRSGETSPWWPWPLLGAGVGAVSMLVATITFLVPLLLVRMGMSVAASRPWRERAPRLAFAAALLVAGLFAGSSPAWTYNYFIARDPVLLSAHSGLNFWMGNNPDATGYPKIPPGLRSSQEGLLKDSITWAEEQVGHPLKRSEVSRYWSAKASAWISAHPGAWAWLMVKKVRNFWNALSYDDLSIITLLKERGVLSPVGFGWGTVATLGLAGAPVLLRRHTLARWVAAAVLLHMLAILPVFVTERYRLAAAPGLIILGCGGLCAAGQAWRAGRWGRVGLYAALLVAAGLFVRWPIADPTLRALDQFNIGVKELETAQSLVETGGSPEELGSNRQQAARERQSARRHLQAAYDLVHGDPGILAALGDLALAEGDSPAAREYYRQTLALNARFTSALHNLGYLALQERQWPEAERWLQAALASDPGNVRSYYLLALTRQGAGDLDGARIALREALARSPAEPKLLQLDLQLNPR